MQSVVKECWTSCWKWHKSNVSQCNLLLICINSKQGKLNKQPADDKIILLLPDNLMNKAKAW